MNDDLDDAQLEAELQALRPAAISARLEDRIFGQLASPMLRPAWWQRLGFVRPTAALGWGLLSPAAAVAVTLAVVRMDAPRSLPSPQPHRADLASESALVNGGPTKATQDAKAVNVLSGAFDEGVIPDGGDKLVRRVRYRSTDHVQWRNPRTGAQWEVSYPREDVLLVPVNAE